MASRGVSTIGSPLTLNDVLLFARNPLLRDRECDGAVAQQAGTHIMVVSVEAENVAVLLGHFRIMP
jgi:hypothetical protein